MSTDDLPKEFPAVRSDSQAAIPAHEHALSEEQVQDVEGSGTTGRVALDSGAKQRARERLKARLQKKKSAEPQ